MSTLFISDLHLDAARPATTALFLRFLREEAGAAEALYILGDLFEAWVGDDASDALADEVRVGLRGLVEAGVAVSVLRGNRDFLLGAGFAADTGVRLLADPAVIWLHGQPCLLMHGDLLCTDDLAYQAFRRQVRDPAWQATFLAQPLAARQAFAAQARAASQQHQAGLAQAQTLESITDVNADAVSATFRQYGIHRLIHGHTHRPAVHSLQVDGRSAQRIVLGDWYTQGSVLRASADGFALTAIG